jgi:hypothetical protein
MVSLRLLEIRQQRLDLVRNQLETLPGARA